MSAERSTAVWHLRRLMADRGMFSTTDLVAPLAERGVSLSREQVYRLVTQTPQRLNLDVLAAVCDFLQCQPNDLLEIVRLPEAKQTRSKTRAAGADLPTRPPRARVRRPS
jgi:DNA-binding Xre family transcriptional regulator